MQIVLSGSTGYIGSEILAQCLNHPVITSVLILTRRDPGDLAKSPKAKVVIVNDFTSYDEATVTELRTADAAIWCLGTKTGDEKVDVDFPLAFIKAIKTRSSESSQFRYIQLGGAFTEPPPEEGQQERSLWFMPNGRRIRGAVEAKVLQAAEEGIHSRFVVHVVKPGAVLPSNTSFLQQYVFGNSLSVTKDMLGATMVDLAVHGSEQKVFYNQDIIRYGRSLQEKVA